LAALEGIIRKKKYEMKAVSALIENLLYTPMHLTRIGYALPFTGKQPHKDI
jgi:hypothetical protein